MPMLKYHHGNVHRQSCSSQALKAFLIVNMLPDQSSTYEIDDDLPSSQNPSPAPVFRFTTDTFTTGNMTSYLDDVVDNFDLSKHLFLSDTRIHIVV